MLRFLRSEGCIDGDGARVAIQGFGNAGRVFSRNAAPGGEVIVAVSDSRGGVAKDDGLDIDRLIQHKLSGASVADYSEKGARRLSDDEVLTVDCEILVPAALGGQITEGNAADIKAELVVELANGPVTAGGDDLLAARDVTVVPDILANAGAFRSRISNGCRTGSASGSPEARCSAAWSSG